MNIEKKVTQFWYPDEPYTGLTKWIYRLCQPLNRSLHHIVTQRMRRRKRLARTAAEPVIVVVGNITVGGTGKTPVIIGLAEWLLQQGYRPGVISRGYRKLSIAEKVNTFRNQSQRVSERVSQIVSEAVSTDQVGDEPKLIQTRTGIPVVVNPKRRQAYDTLRAQFPKVDVILSDDGMQHYALPRHIEISVFDADRGIGNGLLVPSGPLREPLERLETVDAVLLNYTGDTQVNPKLLACLGQNKPYFTFDLQSVGLFRVADDREVPMPESPVIAITGIGHPKRFYQQLERLGLTLKQRIARPDHHPFSSSDFEAFTAQTTVVMTEKDSVKCRPFAKPHWYYLKVSAQFSAPFQAFLEHTFPEQFTQLDDAKI